MLQKVEAQQSVERSAFTNEVFDELYQTGLLRAYRGEHYGLSIRGINYVETLPGPEAVKRELGEHFDIKPPPVVELKLGSVIPASGIQRGERHIEIVSADRPDDQQAHQRKVQEKAVMDENTAVYKSDRELEIERGHAGLDSIGVPRELYGAPLPLDARILVLVAAMGGQTEVIRGKLKRGPRWAEQRSPAKKDGAQT